MSINTVLFLTLSLALIPVLKLNAHSGGLDANGCHAGSQPYHCHRSPSEMVGNRLRCDLGSRSKDCVGSSAASSQRSLPDNSQQTNIPSANASGTPTSASQDISPLRKDLRISRYRKDVRYGKYILVVKNLRCISGIWRSILMKCERQWELILCLFPHK